MRTRILSYKLYMGLIALFALMCVGNTEIIAQNTVITDFSNLNHFQRNKLGNSDTIYHYDQTNRYRLTRAIPSQTVSMWYTENQIDLTVPKGIAGQARNDGS